MLIIPTFMTKLACHTSTTKKADYIHHLAKNETRVNRRSIIMSGKHAVGLFYQSMFIIKVFRVIYQIIFCLDETLYRYCRKQTL